MARLFIAVGSPDTKASSPVFPVYVGRDGDAMQKAMEASPHVVHQIFRGPLGGIFKHNARAAANLAAQNAADEQEGGVVEVSEKDLHEFKEEMKRLQNVAADRSVEIERLTARIAELEKPAPAVVPPNSPEQGESSPAPSTETPAPAPVAEAAPAVEAAKPAPRRR